MLHMPQVRPADMGILGGMEDSILDWFAQFGAASLGLMSFSEAIIQPVPPDLMYIPQLINAKGTTSLILWLWMVVTVTSVAGSLVGYWLGQKWGRSLLDRYASRSSVMRLEALTERYGTVGIFIAAVSPIPYKVFGWVAGMGEMDKRNFVIAGLFGRGIRFGLEAILIGIYGDKVLSTLQWFIDNEFMMGVLLLGGVLIAILAWNWWKGLVPEDIGSEE